MDNYIVVNNQRIELTEEQVRLIIAAQAPTVRLSTLAAGDTFRIGAHEFIVLEQSGDTTAVILRNLLPEQAFGCSNDFRGSEAEKTCNAFAEWIATIIGTENIVDHTVDLTSDDGLKDYGRIKRKASLLTCDLYRRYVEILDRFNPEKYWWLATPYSTKRHKNTSWVRCVAPSGCLFSRGHYFGGNGVRPFCILKSTIFVSK